MCPKFHGLKTQLQLLEYLFDMLYLKYRGSLLFVASEKKVGSLHQGLLAALESRDQKKAHQNHETAFSRRQKHALKSLNSMMAEKQSLT